MVTKADLEYVGGGMYDDPTGATGRWMDRTVLREWDATTNGTDPRKTDAMIDQLIAYGIMLESDDGELVQIPSLWVGMRFIAMCIAKAKTQRFRAQARRN